MSESAHVWAPIRKFLLSRGAHPIRLECYRAGIPDLNVHYQGREYWFELKLGTVLSKTKVKIGVRKEQYVFMKEMVHQGRNVYLIIRIEDDWFLGTPFLIQSKAFIETTTTSTSWDWINENLLRRNNLDHLFDTVFSNPH